MFKIDTNKNIYLTRGDVATIFVTAKNGNGSDYTFKNGDVLRLNVFKKADAHTMVLKKDVLVEEETLTVSIALTSQDTKIGELISKPIDYWYEIVLNPETAPQTIIGYLENPTVFKLLPEGGDVE
jgi:hypothetical protein